MIDADYELAARLQSQEQEELTTKEKSKLFVELMDKRKKHFARPKREEQRTKPPTKAQKRNTKMLQNIDREDLETLWKLVKAKHGLTRPEEGYERVLWGDLKVMFEPDIESEVWRNLQGHKVTVWKLFSSTVGRIVGIKRLHDDQELILLRIFMLENHDLYSNIDKYTNENVKEAVQDALKAPVHESFRELSEFKMKKFSMIGCSKVAPTNHNLNILLSMKL
ncbi:hypothetical protein Tco_1234938 [Tanacetum coccineum]